ncbi:hypothetical protein V866_002451 [Kwoniella sp. B9012]|uniref:Rho termination factor N-terminal domain-containing protein n=1 Tax=Kwoniella europaea PYCC6329 TaxID=1423913 RepID=A0AAX4KF70_9TREE
MYRQEDLSKLKVSDLKGICKQLKALNYSKLAKAALIQLILDISKTSTNPPVKPSLTSPEPIISYRETLPFQGNDHHSNLTNKRKKVETSTKPDTNTADTESSTRHTSVAPQTGVKASKLNLSYLKSGDGQNSKGTTNNRKSQESLKTSTTHSQGKFQPPLPVIKETPTTSIAAPQTLTHASWPTESFMSSLDRLDFLRNHFLNALFVDLNAAREIPILTTPSPTLLRDSTTAVKSYQDLAFPGFGPAMFSKNVSTEGFMVAIRFWLSRLHTLSQLGFTESWSVHGHGQGILGPDLSRWPQVLSCKKISENVWLIETGDNEITSEDKSNIPNKFLTLGINGDVISSNLDKYKGGSIHGCPVRHDWYKYILSDQPSTPGITSLLDHVKTKDPSHHPHGIARAWKERVEARGSAGQLIQIAKRAVLASCALNSFSGSKLSATEMDAHTLGYQTISRGNNSSPVEMYLPESSQVLSVHVDKPPYHPALASVHRHSGITDFVLAETGQVVGNEDEGVSSLWQGFLGCDSNGNENRSNMAAFWKGWEMRMIQ